MDMIDWWMVLQWFVLVFLLCRVYVFGISKLFRHIYHFPVPAFLTRVIDNPIRRRFIQKPEVIAKRMHLKPGMIVVEIGPGITGNWFAYQLNFAKNRVNIRYPAIKRWWVVGLAFLSENCE